VRPGNVDFTPSIIRRNVNMINNGEIGGPNARSPTKVVVRTIIV
jgi:hypothetical protein